MPVALSRRAVLGWALCLLAVLALGSSADVVLYEGFESGLGAWTVDDPVWEVGTPTSGPMAAHSGAQCAATVLGGAYSAGTYGRLISPEIALPSPALGQEIWVRFWVWYVYPVAARASVRVATKQFDGSWSDWADLPDAEVKPWGNGGASPWSLVAKELTGYAGQIVRIAFYHEAVQGGLGIYLDDVEVRASVPVFANPTGFEDGWGDWHTDRGLWGVGPAALGPLGAHTGTQLAGTALSALAPATPHDASLVSPTVYLPSVEAGQQLALHWWEWYSSPSVWASVDASTRQVGGTWGSWVTLDARLLTTATGGWSERQVDLTSYAGSVIRLRFRYGGSDSPTTGWFLDDIELDLPLQAEFVAVPQIGAVPLEVDFSDLSMGGPTSWLWDFGDGGTSTFQNPSHTYTTPGTYEVSLTVGDGVDTDTETKSDYITVLPAMVAQFSGSPTSGFAPLSVTFHDLSTPTPTSWSWDFGDGGNSSFQNPTHQYDTPGVYTVSLTASDAYSSDTETKVHYITVVEPLVADFSAAPLEGAVPLSVTFTDTSTGGPTSWFWSFGDGGTSDQQDPTYEYQTPGRKTVTLVVSNALGSDSETKEHYITVAFTDVALDYWALDEILACMEAGIVQGYPDGSYQPTLTVTRAQMAVYMARALAGGDAAVPDPGCTTPPFPDVECDHWARKYIQYALTEGVVQGYVDGYHPDEVVNRGQMAVYIARALCGGEAGVPDPGCVDPVFPDVPCDFWARKHVQYIKDEGVTGGYPDGNYHPEYTVTRDQMAVYVARAFGLPL